MFKHLLVVLFVILTPASYAFLSGLQIPDAALERFEPKVKADLGICNLAILDYAQANCFPINQYFYKELFIDRIASFLFQIISRDYSVKDCFQRLL